MLGIEYSSVLKNIYSIAAWDLSRLKFGDNFQAVLISNAFRNQTLLQRHKSIASRYKRTTYLGDLLVTAIQSLAAPACFGTI
jgi:glycerol-3-phosphate dehydrogenase (NAD(P)+)